MLPAQPNRSLISGMDCLQAVITAGGPVGSRDVARRLKLEHTRVNRLLGTLKYLGLVEQTADRKYLPGPGVHLLSAQSLQASGLLQAALPHLDRFSGESLLVAMGVLWRGQVCYLVHGSTQRTVAENIGAHQPHPAERSIIGLAMLAACDDAALATTLDQDFELTPDERQELMADITATRRRGYASRIQDGRRSLSVTIGDPAVAALSLTGEIDGRSVGRLVRMLQDAAAAMTDALAGQ
jgi:DNA-binding IclR family transcriptional regulator